MAELKTKATGASVNAFLKRAAGPGRLEDCMTIVEIMRDVSGEAPRMWGTSIVGFGRYRYGDASGHEREWPLIGFSPRKSDITLYLMPGFASVPDLMAKLGKYKTGKSCLYIRKLEDVDVKALRRLCASAVKTMRSMQLNPR